jgi:hypothetical protein
MAVIRRRTREACESSVLVRPSRRTPAHGAARVILAILLAFSKRRGWF